MTEIFSDKSIEYVIELNEIICEQRPEPSGIDDMETFYEIFRKANGFSSESDPKTRIIKKSATLLSGIVWGQPFKNGNKATATATTKYFLRKNGYYLLWENDAEESCYYDLVDKTSLKFEGDPTIYSDIEKYLSDKIRNI